MALAVETLAAMAVAKPSVRRTQGVLMSFGRTRFVDNMVINIKWQC
jgi:hypothetical protein